MRENNNRVRLSSSERAVQPGKSGSAGGLFPCQLLLIERQGTAIMIIISSRYVPQAALTSNLRWQHVQRAAARLLYQCVYCIFACCWDRPTSNVQHPASEQSPSGRKADGRMYKVPDKRTLVGYRIAISIERC